MLRQAAAAKSTSYIIVPLSNPNFLSHTDEKHGRITTYTKIQIHMQCTCIYINMNVDMIRFTQYKTHHKDERLHVCQSQRMSSHDVSMSDGWMRLHRIDLLYRFCAPQQLAMMHVCRRGGDDGYYTDDDDGACGDDDG